MHTVWFKKSYVMPIQLKQVVFSEYTIFAFKEQNRKENEWTDNDDQTVEKILRNFLIFKVQKIHALESKACDWNDNNKVHWHQNDRGSHHSKAIKHMQFKCPFVYSYHVQHVRYFKENAPFCMFFILRTW